MTQEEKQLLIKDLCARLPYGIKFPYHIDEDSNHRECDCVATMDMISEDTVEFTYDENGTIRDWSCSIREVKPYLRPMSSMTKEEKMEFFNVFNACNVRQYTNDERYCFHWYLENAFNFILLTSEVSDALDWLNEHHFDYRGLIEKGLALEAPERMYR